MPGVVDALPQRLRQLRLEAGLTIEALASSSGVSRSMISKIERGEANPTASILAQLAEGLNMTISFLLGEQTQQKIVLIHQEEQLLFRDPETGVERRSLGPHAVGRTIDFVSYRIPPGQKAGPFVPHPPGVMEYIAVTQGGMIATLGSQQITLKCGDSLVYGADLTHSYLNPNDQVCEFILVISESGSRTQEILRRI